MKSQTETPRILVVDDEENIRTLLHQCLAGEGYAIDTAPDGVAGMERVLENEYSLVITDVMMPRLGGLDFLKNVKVSQPELPVVIITGYATTDITIQALKLGAVDFITKPFKLSEIFFTVKRIMDYQGREEEIQHAYEQVSHSAKTFDCLCQELDIDAVLHVIVKELMDLGFCAEADSMKISLAIREAVDNAVEHGNLELPSGHKHKEYMIDPQAFQRWKQQRLQDPQFGRRRIRIEFSYTPGRMEVKVADEGAGFDTSGLPQSIKEAEETGSELHGYRLMLLSMDEVRYNDKGNEVTLVKLRDGSQG
jgi:FixJ family two-component response regulator